MPEEVGSPDGMTVDAGGDLWVAVYGGGRVQRYSPEGDLKAEFAVPAEQTTCCAFAGRGLNRLYVTTATEGWTDDRRRAEPGAGLVYRVDTDAIGQPAAAVRPRPGLVADGHRRARPADDVGGRPRHAAERCLA